MARGVIFPDAQSDCPLQIPQDLLGDAEVSYLRVRVVAAELPNNEGDVWPRHASQVHQLSDQSLVYCQVHLDVVFSLFEEEN